MIPVKNKINQIYRSNTESSRNRTRTNNIKAYIEKGRNIEVLRENNSREYEVQNMEYKDIGCHGKDKRNVKVILANKITGSKNIYIKKLMK